MQDIKALAVPDLIRLYVRPAVIALAKKIEANLIEAYSPFVPHVKRGDTITWKRPA